MNRKGFSNLELLFSSSVIVAAAAFLYSGMSDRRDFIEGFYRDYALRLECASEGDFVSEDLDVAKSLASRLGKEEMEELRRFIDSLRGSP